MSRSSWKTLDILNVLLRADGWLTTSQICSRAGCHHNSLTNAISTLEIHGFGIDVIDGKRGRGEENMYRFNGIYGI